MKLSMDWLSDYVDLRVSPEELAEKLTMGAFEVEEVRAIRGEIKGPIVVGEILEIYPHPNANKIRLTKTRVAPNQEPLEIVCGAGNIEVGQRIPVALAGAQVVDRKEGKPLKIEAREVRGVVSNGMLCSASELGLPADEDGILILSHTPDNPIELGTDAIELLHLRDFVLDVVPRSNRGDALSVMGLAREVAALLKCDLKQPQWSLPEETVPAEELDFVVESERSDDCPFFSARIIDGVTVGPTNEMIKRRLEAIGVRSVNNVVDITNYVMHEFGQPLHAYDYSRIKGKKLIVRRAKPNERIVTLDGKERELNEEVLVIADGEAAVGVAGVMGGKDSEISQDTHTLVLEAASFHPARVRRGSRMLGLSSDSSLRFERGVDVATVARASDRATQLILEHCGSKDGKPRLGKLAKEGHGSVKPIHVTCRMKALHRVIGLDFTPQQVKDLLTPLGFEVVKGACTASDTDAVQVSIPSFRQGDVTREIDIVEEVCRLWGYDNIPVSMPDTFISPEQKGWFDDKIRNALSGLGLSEAWLSSLTGGDDESYGLHKEQQSVRVLNPLSQEHQVLRQTLLPGLIRCASHNYDHGQQTVWLFELGRTYTRSNDPSLDPFDSGTGVLEQKYVSGFLMGTNELSEWLDHRNEERPGAFGFYHARGIIENLFKRMGINLDETLFLRSDKVPSCMHPSRACQVAYEKSGNSHGDPLVLGWIAELHPALSESLRFKQPAYVFELNAEALVKLGKAHKFTGIASTPSLSRDLTVDVYESVDHAALHACIKAAAGSDLRSIDLVSIYLPSPDQKSLSFRLNFQNKERTLTNEEVESALGRVREALVARLSASFRA